MASLAGMLQARGHRVTGSDQNVYPPMSTMLRDLGIEVLQGFRAENLTPAPDCVVVGNAIPRGNPEVEEALNRKLLYRSQAEVVKEEFIRGRHSLAVAGTQVDGSGELRRLRQCHPRLIADDRLRARCQRAEQEDDGGQQSHGVSL